MINYNIENNPVSLAY